MNETQARLASLPLFTDLPDAAVAALADLAKPVSLPVGEVLCRAGDTPRWLFVLVSGRLQKTVAESTSLIDPGDLIGASELLGNHPFAQDILVLRDSQLLRFPAEALEPFLLDHPPVLLALSRYLLHQRQTPRPGHAARQGTLSLVPASPGVPAATLGEELVGRLGGWPRARMVTEAHVLADLGQDSLAGDSDSEQRLETYLHRLEAAHPHLVYVADQGQGVWAERCLRHGDRVLMLVEAGAEPRSVPALAGLPGPLLAPLELVLLCARGDASPHTRAWRELLKARSHYYVQPWYGPDLDALARQITGRGLGLVLGGVAPAALPISA